MKFKPNGADGVFLFLDRNSIPRAVISWSQVRIATVRTISVLIQTLESVGKVTSVFLVSRILVEVLVMMDMV